MVRFFRLIIIFIFSMTGWAAWHFMPSLLSKSALYAALSIWVPTWGLALAFYRKLSELSNLKELKSRQNHRLNLILPEIHARVWWLICVAALSSFALWVLASSDLIWESDLYGLSAGLVGVSFSYLIIIPYWLGEIHRFIERIKLDENVTQRTDNFLKEFGSPKKSSK